MECYYNNSNATESKGYAESIINAVSLSEDIETRYAKTEGYYVLRNTQLPAVLVEMGFLSNYSESQKLLDDDYQESLAQRIAEGISNKKRLASCPHMYSYCVVFPMAGGGGISRRIFKGTVRRGAFGSRNDRENRAADNHGYCKYGCAGRGGSRKRLLLSGSQGA